MGNFYFVLKFHKSNYLIAILKNGFLTHTEEL